MPEIPFPDPALASGGTRLRPLTGADVPAVVTACQDPEMTRFLTELPWPYGAKDARQWLSASEEARMAGHAISFAITSVGDERLLGAIGVNRMSGTRATPSIGYWIAPDARRHGHAASALRLVCLWLFEVRGFKRVELTTAPDNIGSQRVAVAVGFHQEGYLRQNLQFVSDGRRRDSLLFGLLAADLLPERREESEPERPRVLWLNGTFGAGKSSAAAELQRRLPGLVMFDPEYVGLMLREFIAVPTGDFQDLPEWRESVAATVASLARHQAGTLLIPMTLLRREYLLEIFTALRVAGVELTHVLLDAPDQVLVARIDADTAQPPETVAFRRSRLVDYTDAREWLRASADLTIDTAALDVAGVADRVAPLLQA